MKEGFLRRFRDISPMQVILLGYCLIILMGTILLQLPFAVKTGQETDWLTSFFTAASATCVTGLIRMDTYTHWSIFGQVVLLCLIQIGGIGFMTLCISTISMTKKRIGYVTRSLMQSSISAPQLGGIVRMTKFILWGTFVVEGTGALLLAFFFCPLYGLGKGLWFSVFHSISAFCNAGFDLMGGRMMFSSFMTEAGNWYVNSILMALIVIGGLGFFVWSDLLEGRLRFSKMHLHTKLVLSISVILILGGGISFYYMGGEAMAGLSVGEHILVSLFQSVSARTAGFNTIDIGAMTEAGRFLMICFMLIGGSPGSTAGGIKTTTFAVLMLSILTTFRHRKSVEVFGRRMEEGIARTASCVFMMYLLAVAFVAVVISQVEGLPLLNTLFESTSAIATVGLTTGMTPGLGNVSLLLLSLLMIFGRVGSLTLLLAFSSRKTPVVSTLPLEKVPIG